MDALILSCGTGGGHNAAGHAIEEELIRRGDTVRFLNPYRLVSPELERSIDTGYIRLAVKAPRAFGAVYRIGNAYRRIPFRSPVFHANRTMAPVVARYLEEHPTDVVFMPHLYPAEIMTQLKSLGVRVPLTVFIGTDYACIPFTEETDCDLYVIPSPELTHEYLARGVPEEKIRPLGIPVSRRFSHPLSREEACASLGLDPSVRHLLILGGSIGAGAVEDTLDSFMPKADGLGIRPVVICGSNASLLAKLSKKYGDRAVLLSQTDRVADYLAACDIVTGKPGGLSSPEAAVLGRPLIHTAPIPGCETLNRNFFTSRGMCIPVDDLRRDLLPAVRTLSREENAKAMTDSQAFWISKTAAHDICGEAAAMLGV